MTPIVSDDGILNDGTKLMDTPLKDEIIEKNDGNYCRSFTFDNKEAYVYLINL